MFRNNFEDKNMSLSELEKMIDYIPNVYKNELLELIYVLKAWELISILSPTAKRSNIDRRPDHVTTSTIIGLSVACVAHLITGNMAGNMRDGNLALQASEATSRKR